MAFRNPWAGIVGGGDPDPANPNGAATATSSDGGVTWALTNPPPVTGAIFGPAYAHGVGNGDGSRTVVITANAGGADWTPDEERQTGDGQHVVHIPVGRSFDEGLLAQTRAAMGVAARGPLAQSREPIL